MTAIATVQFGDPRLPASFWNRVTVQDNGCWTWGKAIQSQGYASCWDYVSRKSKLGHRHAYETTVGPIPDGMQLDHRCHTDDKTCLGGKTCLHRRCVNPAHLEPVTQPENHRRGLSPSAVNGRRTHCVNDHEFTPDNTEFRSDGRRNCIACRFVNGPHKRPGVRPGSAWSPARRAAYEAQKANRYATSVPT